MSQCQEHFHLQIAKYIFSYVSYQTISRLDYAYKYKILPYMLYIGPALSRGVNIFYSAHDNMFCSINATCIIFYRRTRDILKLTVCLYLCMCVGKFLVRLKIMDYSLLLGIHDVGRAEQDEAEEMKDSFGEEEEDSENGLSFMAVGSFGTSPEGIAGYMSSYKPLGPGEFDPYVDVYAIQSAVGESHPSLYTVNKSALFTCQAVHENIQRNNR